MRRLFLSDQWQPLGKPMKNTLIDNSTDTLKMSSVLKKCIKDEKFTEILIATGYWDLPGMVAIYDELKTFLERENTFLRLIIGKEPMIRQYQQAVHLERDDFPGQYLKTDINKLSLTPDYQKVVNLLLQYCNVEDDNSKFQIRIYGQGVEEKFLHAKCYIFKGINDACGFIGSSNFTFKGLDDNAELNYLETDPTRITATQIAVANQKSHLMWFNEKWEQSQPWNQTFLEEILKPSPLGKKVIEEQKNTEKKIIEITPHEAYIKFLQNVWGDVLDSDWQKNPEKFFPVDPQFKLLQYQIDAVNQGFSIMRKHGGFILADVVGLGKTMVGIMVIKRFLLEYGVDRPVLIVAPPAIKGSWEETINYFDQERDFKIKNHVQFITTGSISKLVDDENEDEDIESDEFEGEIDLSQNYGLVLVDESHKFRNSDTNMYKDLVSITEKQPRPYVVLLSATPQNNRPNDLKNQIYLFQHEHANTTLETIPDKKLDTYFNGIATRYQDLISAKRNGEKKSDKELADDLKMLKHIAEDLRKKIVEPLVVRRTRTDIEKYFEDDMESQGLKFPKIKGPNEIIYKMDNKLSELFYDTIEIIAAENINNASQSLGFYRYRAIEFLKNEADRALYEGRKGKRKVKVQDTSARLAKIMQILLVKRLESSFDAFRQSLRNLMQYCNNMIEMIENDTVFICPDIDVNTELSEENRKKRTLDGCYRHIREKIKTKPDKNKEYKAEALKNEYLEKLQADSEIIKNLLDRWERIKDDPKLETFMFEMNGKFFSKETNNPHSLHDQKLVIFTEAIDTVNILKSKLKNTNHKVLDITASNRDKMRETIKANFDANYTGIQRNDYDVLITTEVLAEGVNLHRSNVIVNYDTPWNSTRLMQRIGRVNRIGSKEDFVYVYNFFPSSQGDAQLELVKKALTKLQAFHTVFGEDSQVFSHEEEVVMHGMTKFVVDESETPTTKFIDYLKRFKADKPIDYARIFQLPSGLCAAKIADNESILFHIKANEKDTGLYYQTDSEGVPKQLSPIEMAEFLQCKEAEPSALPLPENWQIIRDRVYLTFEEYLKNSGLITSSHLSTQSKKGLSILGGIIRNEKGLPQEIKDKLITAKGLISQGNDTLARQLIKLDATLQKSLFEEDKIGFITDFVERHLKNIKQTAKENKAIEPYTVLSVAIKSAN